MARLAMIKCAFLEMTFSVGERAVRAGVRAELLPRDVRVALLPSTVRFSGSPPVVSEFRSGR